jgi:hypothetical protein
VRLGSEIGIGVDKPPRARRGPAEGGRQDHGHVGSRQHGSRCQPSPREARSREKTQPPPIVRHGHPFLLGHQLARIEGKCALEAVFKRWPELELAVPADSIRWRQRLASGPSKSFLSGSTANDLPFRRCLPATAGTPENWGAAAAADHRALASFVRSAFEWSSTAEAMALPRAICGPTTCIRVLLTSAGIGRMSARGANRTRRNGGNDVNDPRLCKNAKTLDRDRTSYSFKPALVGRVRAH